MKKYDVVIPLGEFCATAVALRDAQIRLASYPFDWSAGIRWEKCGNCGFMGKINMICNDFKDAFNLEDLEEFWSSQTKHRGVINKRTGLQYVHDFEWGRSVADQYPEYLEKYQRRIRRFYDDINNSGKILFVFITRLSHQLSLEQIEKGLKLLNDKFVGKDIDFLLLQSCADCDSREIRYLQADEHIHIYLYKDTSAETGNQELMKRILSAFINGSQTYNFATDDIKNYGLSVRENWGRWSDGKFVFMELPVFAKNDISIDFAIMPYIVKEHPLQDVEIFMGDEKIADWRFEFGKALPSTVLQIAADKVTGPTLALKFKIKDPVSLKELGLGEGTRKLGIGFKTVTIKAK